MSRRHTLALLACLGCSRPSAAPTDGGPRRPGPEAGVVLRDIIPCPGTRKGSVPADDAGTSLPEISIQVYDHGCRPWPEVPALAPPGAGPLIVKPGLKWVLQGSRDLDWARLMLPVAKVAGPATLTRDGLVCLPHVGGAQVGCAGAEGRLRWVAEGSGPTVAGPVAAPDGRLWWLTEDGTLQYATPDGAVFFVARVWDLPEPYPGETAIVPGPEGTLATFGFVSGGDYVHGMVVFCRDGRRLWELDRPVGGGSASRDGYWVPYAQRGAPYAKKAVLLRADGSVAAVVERLDRAVYPVAVADGRVLLWSSPPWDPRAPPQSGYEVAFAEAPAWQPGLWRHTEWIPALASCHGDLVGRALDQSRAYSRFYAVAAGGSEHAFKPEGWGLASPVLGGDGSLVVLRRDTAVGYQGHVAVLRADGTERYRIEVDGVAPGDTSYDPVLAPDGSLYFAGSVERPPDDATRSGTPESVLVAVQTDVPGHPPASWVRADRDPGRCRSTLCDPSTGGF